MNNATPSNPILTPQPIYQQIADANEASTKLLETQTDILSPKFQFSPNRPSEDSMMVVDEQQNEHRVDSRHESTGQSHLSMRLEKFMQLSRQYAPPQPQSPVKPESDSPAEPKTSPSIPPTTSTATFSAKANWETETLQNFVGAPEAPTSTPAKQNIIPPTKPSGETTIGSRTIKVRIDPEQRKAPHFNVDNTPGTDQPPRINETVVRVAQPKPSKEGRLWKVDSLQWPAITDHLLGDPSLTIDRIGSNVIKLMTGVQNHLMVTSTQRGEGVTTLAISIARWARGLNRQVLLVDADLQKASLTQGIGLGREVNWLATLNHPKNVGDVIVQDQNTGMFVMPLLAMTDRSNLPSNIFQALGTMLEPISDCFDLIVMDMGPSSQFLNETTRADLVADVGLLVKDGSQTQPKDFGDAKTNLLSAGIAKMIVAENFAGNTNS